MKDGDAMTVEMCRSVHSQSLEQFGLIQASLNELNARLYKDNGTLSIQTRLDRTDRIMSLLIWILSVVGSTLLVTLVTFGIASARYLLKVIP